MPIHDWTRVDAGIFHDFHHSWTRAIKRVLNKRVLPPEYYALPEQHGVGFEPDVLTPRARAGSQPDEGPAGRQTVRRPDQGNGSEKGAGGLLVAEPQVTIRAKTDLEFYRRKQNVVAVRHAAGDELVAVVELVSKGNKSGRVAFDDFVRKAAKFLQHCVHLLILDLQPPTSRDPQGIHGAIWDAVAGQDYIRPADKPLTLAAYESVAVGDTLIDMPLYLEPGRYVAVPFEETYRNAFDDVPWRWRTVLEPE
jgi:hypothetical protein